MSDYRFLGCKCVTYNEWGVFTSLRIACYKVRKTIRPSTCKFIYFTNWKLYLNILTSVRLLLHLPDIYRQFIGYFGNLNITIYKLYIEIILQNKFYSHKYKRLYSTASKFSTIYSTVYIQKILRSTQYNSDLNNILFELTDDSNDCVVGNTVTEQVSVNLFPYDRFSFQFCFLSGVVKPIWCHLLNDVNGLAPPPPPSMSTSVLVLYLT